MKLLFRLLLILFIFSSCQEPIQNKEPKYWCWLSYNPEMNANAVFRKIADMGIDGVLLAALNDEYKELIPVAKSYGLEVHAWRWILNQPKSQMIKDHPGWYAVNGNGRSIINDTTYANHYKFLCPALPSVRNFVTEEVESLLDIEGLDGVCLDYIRWPDVMLPEKLQEITGVKQDREYGEWDYGYHPYMIEKFKTKHGYDPRTKENVTADLQWKQFRYDQVTEMVNVLADMAHEKGKKISANVYPTPTLGKKHARQDWGRWNLDYAFPMIYTGFYAEDGPNWIAACIKEDMKTVGSKMKVYSGLFAPGHKENVLNMPQAMHVAEDAGVDGVAIFSFSSFDDYTTALIKDYISQNN